MFRVKTSSIILSVFLGFAACVGAQAQAQSMVDSTSAVRGALNQGVDVAVGKLGLAGGYLNNPKVKIPLPEPLFSAQKALRFAGLNKEVDELVNKMNAAAEAAVPMAKPVLLNAIKSMTVTDAKKILTGGDTAVTDFFKLKSQDQLKTALFPIVKQSTDKVGLAQQYNSFASKAKPLGLIKGDAANIETYVTGKALDGLFVLIAEEEKKIRQNPLSAVGDVVKKVFGGLK